MNIRVPLHDGHFEPKDAISKVLVEIKFAVHALYLTHCINSCFKSDFETVNLLTALKNHSSCFTKYITGKLAKKPFTLSHRLFVSQANLCVYHILKFELCALKGRGSRIPVKIVTQIH